MAQRICSDSSPELQNVAVSIDARNISEDLQEFPQIFKRLEQPELDTQIIFLDADPGILLKRFSEARRKHPLTNQDIGLMKAIIREKNYLSS